MASILSPTTALPINLSPFSSPSSSKLSVISGSAITFRSSVSASASAVSPELKTVKTPTSKQSPEPTKTLSPATTTTIATDSDGTTAAVPTKKVLVPIGYGTEEMEAVILVDVLRRAGAEVTVASVEPQLEIEASSGTRLVADTCISTCSDQVFDLVALPGGMPGSARLRDCKILKEITSKQAKERRLYGAICAAPAITLLPWGLLKSKQSTCHPAFHDKLPTFRAVKSRIKVSGELTTSRGPGTSYEFALCLVDQLFGESVAKEIGKSLLLHRVDDDNLRKEEFNEVEWSLDHNPRVLIPVANGSEEIEVVTIADTLRRARVDVVVASVEKSLQIVASQGAKIVADKLLSDAAKSIYDLIILPVGTAGPERLQKSRILKKLLKEQDSAGRIYRAVCSSPAILYKHGLLKDKRATAHPSVVSKITNEVVNGTKVVIDGKLITSRGLATVTDFALAIVSKLFGHGRARCVAEGIVFEFPSKP